VTGSDPSGRAEPDPDPDPQPASEPAPAESPPATTDRPGEAGAAPGRADGCHVCHLVHHLALGGLETQLLRVIEATADDVSFTAAYFGDDTSMRQDYRGAGVRTHGFDAGSDNPARQFAPDVLGSVVRFLGRQDVDVVHAHGSLYLLLLGRICGRLAGVPAVGTYHNPSDSFSAPMRLAERVTRPLSAVDVAVSKDVERSYAGDARRYANGAGLDRPTYTVYNGIDVAAFRSAVDGADPSELRAEHGVADGPVYLNIGRYTERKNQASLVRAMATLLDEVPGAHLFLVGWGPEEEPLRRLVAEHGIEDSVSITGRRRDVERFYALADVFVLPSNAEGLSVVVLEAMAAGLPVVGTDVPGTNEAVVDGQGGVIVPPDSPAALAEAMARLAGREERERFGRNAYERVRSEFSVDRTAAAYRDIYRSLA
jgi:glycosyltransferase involved in cell wall biosynthesis